LIIDSLAATPQTQGVVLNITMKLNAFVREGAAPAADDQAAPAEEASAAQPAPVEPAAQTQPQPAAEQDQVAGPPPPPPPAANSAAPPQMIMRQMRGPRMERRAQPQ
jgi:hypothetical protein